MLLSGAIASAVSVRAHGSARRRDRWWIRLHAGDRVRASRTRVRRLRRRDARAARHRRRMPLDLQRRLTAGILRSRGAGDVRVEAHVDRAPRAGGRGPGPGGVPPGRVRGPPPGRADRDRPRRDRAGDGGPGRVRDGPALGARSCSTIADETAAGSRTDGAVLLDYTNPVQIVSEACTRFAPAGALRRPVRSDRRRAALPRPALGCDAVGDRTRHVRHQPHDVHPRGAHRRARRDRRRVGSPRHGWRWTTSDTDQERRIVRLFRMLRHIPSEYMQYFLFHDEVLAEQRARATTRARGGDGDAARGPGELPGARPIASTRSRRWPARARNTATSPSR